MFLVHYGNFLTFWSTFETILEVLIMRELRLTPEETSIVCSGMGAEAKLKTAKWLLSRNEKNKDGIALMLHARELAARNSFAHGFFRWDAETGDFTLIKRTGKDKYTPSAEHMDDTKMDTRHGQFAKKVGEAQRFFGVTDAELDTYQQSIEDHAKALAARGKRPSQSHPSSD